MGMIGADQGDARTVLKKREGKPGASYPTNEDPQSGSENTKGPLLGYAKKKIYQNKKKGGKRGKGGEKNIVHGYTEKPNFGRRSKTNLK